MSLPQPQPGIMSIKPYVAGKSKAGTQKIIKLSSNENNLGASPLAVQAIAESAAKVHRYPDSRCAELREAIGQVYKMNPARIVCGAGSDELIGLLVNAYAGSGDEVLYSQHGFLMYKIYTLGAGATPVVAPEKNLIADVDAILAHVTPRTKLVFIANPNNPTGSCLPASELKRLHKGLPENVILVIDDAYAEYVDSPDYSDGRELVDEAHNVVMLRTFSKIYGLSALRLGWGYFPEGIADVLNRVRGPFNVSAVAQAAGVAAIKDVQYVQKAKEHNTKWREWVSKQLASNVMTVHPSAANFILVQFPGGKLSAQAANAFLLERGIIPREVGEYGLPDCLRITIGTEEENRALVDGLKAFVESNA
ncbi:MAG TPA: histidinol-phosphate transaminase [Rickettsiales bacterium]|nr:histidinol-phosphate transaminase [Rickettsiales bacterium]